MHAIRQIGRHKATGAAAVGYAEPTANPHSQSGCTARPQAIVHRGTELRPRGTWPQNHGATRQPVRICVTRLDTSNVHIR